MQITQMILCFLQIPSSESLMHSLDQAARGIGVNVNSAKIKFLYFNEDGAISS